MTELHTLELRGCTPEPLMAYLKALGIFRIVAEQADENARAWWENDTFFLHSTLGREELTAFFLDEYRPTPIVSPWNGGSGFFPPVSTTKTMDTILGLESPRFQLWYEVISVAKEILADAQVGEGIPSSDKLKQAVQANNGVLKTRILSQCRAKFPDDALNWLDASYVLTSGGRRFPPLLGTGGVDGKLEFSNNYMQNLVSALNLNERRNGEAISKEQLKAALFDEGSPRLKKGQSTGFFNPSSVKAPNSDVGFQGDRLTNPWDYVLMLEGALLFAGAAARRLSPQSRTKVVFPFTVDNSAGGYGTATDSEYGDSSRAEFWAPAWDCPVSFRELSHLVSEGRAQLGQRQVATGTDFARAVAGLGTERGVSQFHRYGFMVRNGLAYLAAPLGRFRVQQDNTAVDRANVLFDLDQWTDRLRRQLSGRNAPAGLGTALRRIDDAIMEFCQNGQPRNLQNVLIAVGQMERWLAKSSISKDTDRGRGVQPLANLSGQWIQHANDKTAEFRLALAIASILGESAEVGPIRNNLEPVDTRGITEWKPGSTSFVWTSGDVLSSMLAVLERRCLDGRMNGLNHPPLDSQYSPLLVDIVDFLNGNVDVQRIVGLALPLSFIPYRHRQPGSGSDRSPQPYAPFELPTAYAVMKLTLLPRKFKCQEFGADTDIWTEPALLPLLRAGRVNDAYAVAYRRLKASGLRPLSDSPGISDSSDYGRRLASALLFPLDRTTNKALAQRALRQSESELAEQTGI